jgi:hypothetical protein
LLTAMHGAPGNVEPILCSTDCNFTWTTKGINRWYLVLCQALHAISMCRVKQTCSVCKLNGAHDCHPTVLNLRHSIAFRARCMERDTTCGSQQEQKTTEALSSKGFMNHTSIRGPPYTQDEQLVEGTCLPSEIGNSVCCTQCQAQEDFMRRHSSTHLMPHCQKPHRRLVVASCLACLATALKPFAAGRTP